MNKRERREQERQAGTSGAAPTPAAAAETTSSSAAPASTPTRHPLLAAFDGTFGNFHFLRIRGKNNPTEYDDKSATSFRLCDVLIEIGQPGSRFLLRGGTVKAVVPGTKETWTGAEVANVEFHYPKTGSKYTSKACVEGVDGASDAMLQAFGRDIIMPAFRAWQEKEDAKGAGYVPALAAPSAGYQVSAASLGIKLPAAPAAPAKE
jgi:hypothetical protein